MSEIGIYGVTQWYSVNNAFSLCDAA